MTFELWAAFAVFWALFVTTPGPNAVNCITVGMHVGLPRAFITVGAILLQALLFMWAAALGLAALIVATPNLFFALQIAGAALLVWIGLRALLMAGRPPVVSDQTGGLFWRAFWIATINAKSLAGYIAAFSQFLDPARPVMGQMAFIMPTALSLTALSYAGFTTLGAMLGRAALGAVFHTAFRRIMAVCFIGYGLALFALAIMG
ncbi:LysE family transporter [Thalassobacter stenotrophicus]|uniref:LysE family translocator n=1 Tax=Thalassobacter stenotrophicus TaxID=266809 RepID=UPI0022A9F47C|nr:LysE family transporter [Thalassobacter stenotrophicus]UYP67963.1 LysE family transporter [Thalassobacter stenotrophicus]